MNLKNLTQPEKNILIIGSLFNIVAPIQQNEHAIETFDFRQIKKLRSDLNRVIDLIEETGAANE